MYLPKDGVDRPSNDSTPCSNAAVSITDRSSQDFVALMLEGARTSLATYGRDFPFLRTPVFLGHGTDDAYVDVSLGCQARVVLSDIGFDVTWKEYVGAEQEGHGYKEPEELDDIAWVLSNIATA